MTTLIRRLAGFGCHKFVLTLEAHLCSHNESSQHCHLYFVIVVFIIRTRDEPDRLPESETSPDDCLYLLVYVGDVAPLVEILDLLQVRIDFAADGFVRISADNAS
ncbi:hypothetical protein PMIN06_009643 [Paraphaeosphaeria minitans]